LPAVIASKTVEDSVQEISRRLEDIRSRMADSGLDALIVPRADEYLGEYVPEHNERLRWISGFSGSAGVVIVLRDSAVIFVDGRYTVQVREQVPDELFDFLDLYEQPHVEWLAGRLEAGARVGYDPRMHSLEWQRAAVKALEAKGLDLVETAENLVDLCWTDRPRAPVHEALLLAEKYTGRDSQSKRREIGAALAEQGADAALIFSADSVAWLLNIRGRDIPSLPLVLGYALLQANGDMMFFTDPRKIPVSFADHVGDGVTVLEESEAASEFARLAGRKVLADPQTANAWCQLALQRAGAELVAAADPVLVPKACKNETEIEGMQDAHLRDGIAECRFLCWLDDEVSAGRLHDEAFLSDRLLDYRRQQDLFQEVSFDTISAAAGNAAMCHYNHLNGTPARLEMDSVYLVDSGGQYLDGTTDITRTVAIGDPGPEVRRMFTLVLKGHIALDQVRFPEGTNGTQLDSFARQFLWQEGFDYEHGTGHGVGCFLSVHEGPQGISKRINTTALQPNMVVSNEPGYYKAGVYGIRCENLVRVVEVGKLADSDKRLFGFESLTLAPFDLRLVEAGLLTDEEKEWLDRYHERVFECISPFLEDREHEWLRRATRPLRPLSENAA
jgi:Xaa-Pro aminopeptidase